MRERVKSKKHGCIKIGTEGKREVVMRRRKEKNEK